MYGKMFILYKLEEFMRIHVTSDSTCDLSPELIAQYNIQISPLYVVLDGKAYRDTLEITPDDIYAYVERTKKVGSTAALNVSDYLEFFRANLEGYDAIIHFTISSDMSSCYQNACLAAEEVGNVYVVDSRSLSLGIGLLALDAAELAAEGKTPQEICRETEARREKLDISFVLDTLQYLALGGRCHAVVALGANLLGLKPAILVQDGKMTVGKKYRMSPDRAAMRYIREHIGDPSSVDPRRVFIVDSGVSPEMREEATQLVHELLPEANILFGRAGCAISNHCGPNTFSLMFYRKAR